MSMPHISVTNQTFSYKNPAYQSAHPQINSDMTEVASTNSNSNSTTASTKPLTSKSDDSSNRSKGKQQPQSDAKGKSVVKADNYQSMHIGENYEVSLRNKLSVSNNRKTRLIMIFNFYFRTHHNHQLIVNQNNGNSNMCGR